MNPLILFLVIGLVSAQHTDFHEDTEGIIGGEPAEVGKFPHHVFIRYDADPVGGRTMYKICGGSLISTNHVLTAAHCVHKNKEGWIMVGSVNKWNYQEGQWRRIQGSSVHHAYNSVTLLNDIAILKIEPIALNENVKLIQIPRNDDALIGDSTDARISGFGAVGYNGQSTVNTQVLRWNTVKIYNSQICQSTGWLQGRVTENQICGGGFKLGVAHGDSGSAVIVERNSKYFQVGVVSYVYMNYNIIPYYQNLYPSVFIRASKYCDWIYQNSGVLCV
ncbi:hypothetical protein QR680_011546 [Steinernema hermaphroditum]|uniref:Peptidase S1 domain-containing protein n=1 Tax=Steinernema hermaphroditum TaxID=289476 RepID=A0AA39HYX7_9BILA|nr:hypothetical protein QR680_011546 [Steinernema hermaphroditum]